jgi:hypothetical protein
VSEYTSASVPKSMGKLQEDAYSGIPVKWILVFCAWVGISLCFLAPVMLFTVSVYLKYTLLALFVLWWAVYIKWFRSTAVMERTVLILTYLGRSCRGYTSIRKYTVPLPFLHSVVPLIAIHPDGVIEFTGRSFGLMLKADPPRVSDDDLSRHINQVVYVVNSLYDDIILKTIAVSRTDESKPLQKTIIDATNQPDISGPQKDHLYALYHELDRTSRPVIDWEFRIFVGLGVHDSVESAEVRRLEYLPGLLSSLEKTGMHCLPMTDRNEIALAYRTIMAAW